MTHVGISKKRQSSQHVKSRSIELMKFIPVSRVRKLQQLDPDDTVRLYSYQGQEAYDHLMTKGYLAGDTTHLEADDFFAEPYAWMREQMALRIENFSGDYPVWAWLKRPSTKPKPKKYKGTDEKYRIIAKVPMKRLLINDYEQWHFPLNRGPICPTEEEYDAFDGDIKATWPRIFDFDRPKTKKEIAWCGDPSKMILQVCADRIYENEIISVRIFD